MVFNKYIFFALQEIELPIPSKAFGGKGKGKKGKGAGRPKGSSTFYELSTQAL